MPDDALAGVVAGLAGPARCGPGRSSRTPRGAHGLAVLAPAAAAGARPLALHPAMTFTGHADDLARLPGIAYGLTAPAELRALAARLVTDLGGVPEWVAEDDRPLYHAALAHGANHLVTLVNEAADLLRAAGVEQPATVLAPLLRAALDNALRLGDAALTGPVSRGDAGTVAQAPGPAGRAGVRPRVSGPGPAHRRPGHRGRRLRPRGRRGRCSTCWPAPARPDP